MKEGDRTPWGHADYVKEIVPGVWTVGTPGHGGIKLDRAHNAKIPDYMRRKGGWYEEDCEWAIPFCVLEAELKDTENGKRTYPEEHHKKTLRDYFPEAYERFYKTLLKSGESFKRDEENFLKEHKDDWIVISALGDHAEGVPKGMVRCIATKGGSRGTMTGIGLALPVERVFLVPKKEYRAGRFVIDPHRHTEVHG